MELKELCQKTMSLFCVDDISKLTEKLGQVCINMEYSYFDSFVKMVDGDLSTDWLQMIFQYYQADRKEKKQDY